MIINDAPRCIISFYQELVSSDYTDMKWKQPELTECSKSSTKEINIETSTTISELELSQKVIKYCG